MIDYFTMSESIFIRSTENGLGKFGCYDYNEKLVCNFNIITETSRNIEFNVEVKEDKFILEAINIFSEMLYFAGNKSKDIWLQEIRNYSIDLSKIGFKYYKNKYLKKVAQFEKEREKKFETIDELYKFPYLVPWNLVSREWDVINIVQKFVGKEKVILEIGSGYGKNLLLLKQIGYRNVKGIEYSPNAVKIANNFQNINVKLESIVNPSFQDEEFDAILDIGCLHCIAKAERNVALRQVYRILKKDGLIISRYFLPKSKKWIERYPVTVNEFGNTFQEVKEFIENLFDIETAFCSDDCVYIVGRVKK